MAAELKTALGSEATLVVGGGGIFDVKVDEKLLFSKHDLGRFPEPGEILGLIQG